jgi:hypothetical protein
MDRGKYFATFMESDMDKDTLYICKRRFETCLWRGLINQAPTAFRDIIYIEINDIRGEEWRTVPSDERARGLSPLLKA